MKHPNETGESDTAAATLGDSVDPMAAMPQITKGVRRLNVGDLVDLKTDKRWRRGTVKQIVHDRAYVSRPENEDNGYSAYSPHLITNLILADTQLSRFEIAEIESLRIGG